MCFPNYFVNNTLCMDFMSTHASYYVTLLMYLESIHKLFEFLILEILHLVINEDVYV